jgi:hypothetical protein
VTKLFWLAGPWRGKVALAARRRGGDWLEDDVVDWKGAGVQSVLSLLTREENSELGLRDEGREDWSFPPFRFPIFKFPGPSRRLGKCWTRLLETCRVGRTS